MKGRDRGRHAHTYRVGLFLFNSFWVQKMPAKREPAVIELSRRAERLAALGSSQRPEADWKQHA